MLTGGADRLLRDLIHERTGLFFDNGKGDILTDKLSPLVIERGFTSLLDYYYLLKYDEAAQDEWLSVMNALSVPETYFWREMDQVRALVDVVVPRWFAAPGAGPLKIWSAACATGEEPLTIAMALDEAGWLGRAPIEIHASDASPAAVEKARRGVYRERSFRNLPAELRAKYFTQEGATKRGALTLSCTRRVRWGVVNLMNEAEVAPRASANVIFCRNVFIYFSDQPSAGRCARSPSTSGRRGYLFVAASESLLRLTDRFRVAGDRERVRVREAAERGLNAAPRSEGLFMDRVLRVLVVDDSAYVRKVVKQMLSRSPFLEVVGTARDGREALELVEQLDPDVVTCDLIMPELDGVGFVREQMARRPVPIIIMSIASETGEAALTALDAGAVDFVQKPTALATEKIFEVSDELIEKVKAAAEHPDGARHSVAAPPARGDAADPGRGHAQGAGGRGRHRHFDRRPAGAQAVDPATARRLPGARRDRHAHAGRLH